MRRWDLTTYKIFVKLNQFRNLSVPIASTYRYNIVLVQLFQDFLHFIKNFRNLGSWDSKFEIFEMFESYFLSVIEFDMLLFKLL